MEQNRLLTKSVQLVEARLGSALDAITVDRAVLGLFFTGVTILKDTLPELLTLAKPGAEILVTGPTASMLPDALFEAGITMTGGILVTDADAALDILSEGGSGYHLFGKSAERTVIRRRPISS